MIINHNMSAMYANRALGLATGGVQSNLEKLSSGERINRAADDASGLAVSEKMRSQIRGLNMASQNIQNGASFVQTTEGYLQGISNVLQRVRELAVQSSNGIYTSEDRMQIQVEVEELIAEIDRIADQAEFNGMKILDGTQFTEENPLQIHVGANMDQRVAMHVGNMHVAALFDQDQGQAAPAAETAPAADAGAPVEGAIVVDLSTADGANMAIGMLDDAMEKVNKQRADLGAYQNRFDMAKKSVDNAAENLQAAESRIRDTDMAKLMVEYTKNQILVQSGTAMLAQANTTSQNVLGLLR